MLEIRKGGGSIDHTSKMEKMRGWWLWRIKGSIWMWNPGKERREEKIRGVWGSV